MSVFKKNKNKTLKLRLGQEMGQTPSILILHFISRTILLLLGQIRTSLPSLPKVNKRRYFFSKKKKKISGDISNHYNFFF